MKYFFIFGRNPELSLAELFSYLEKENNEILNYSRNENSLIIETKNSINLDKAIKSLGGTIALGEILCAGKQKEILNFIDKNEIYFGEEIKFNYSVMQFAEDIVFDDILQKIKDKFKEEKLKALFRSTLGTLDIQQSGFVKGSPKKMKSKDVIYFVFNSEQNKEIYFGEIKKISDSDETESRDMNKPVRREALAISPRLAKILINLSQVKENETLLDPFCGVGTIISEAVIQNINAIGIDIDKDAIFGARKNLNWLKAKYNFTTKYNIINDDSRRIRINNSNGIATEPSLGELLKITPTEQKASLMIERFENLMIEILNNLKSSLIMGSKIAFTSPLIRTNSRKIGCNISRIAAATKLKQAKIKSLPSLHFPIIETRKDSIVAREFYVLEKS